MTTWWKRKWVEGRTGKNWEDARAKGEDPVGVLAGLKPLHRAKTGKQRASAPRLLDGGNAGRSEVINVTDTGAEGRSLINLVGDDQNATVLSVVLVASVTQPPPVPGGTIAPSGRAIVEWGVSGVQARAIVDFILGTTFSLPCSFLRVNAIRIPEFGLPDSIGVVLGAFASYLPISGGKPQLTLFSELDAVGAGVFPIAPAGSASFLVPAFAETLDVRRLSSVTGALPAMTVTTRSVTGTTIDVQSRAAGAPWGEPVRLPNDARQIAITNDEGVATIPRARLIFRLGF